jgi:hypothetical protein
MIRGAAFVHDREGETLPHRDTPSDQNVPKCQEADEMVNAEHFWMGKKRKRKKKNT